MPLFAPLNPPLPAWPDARVWVIGASYGIGAATARALLAAGARVALSARSEDKLARVWPRPTRTGRWWRRSISRSGRRSPRRGSASMAQWGGCDLVLVVAGTHREIRAWDLTEAGADALLETNLNGAAGDGRRGGARPASRRAAARSASSSSVAGYRGLPKALVYGASKAALINFTETLYLDLHPRGIGVYLINPGFVDTPLTARNEFRMPHLITAEDAAREILAGLARRRLRDPLPARVHAQAQAPAPAALPAVLRRRPQGDRRMSPTGRPRANTGARSAKAFR